MQNRTQIDIAAWRAAAGRGELWMYVDQHWSENAPEDLTEQEWGEHVGARVYVKTGKYPHARFVESSAPARSESR